MSNACLKKTLENLGILSGIETVDRLFRIGDLEKTFQKNSCHVEGWDLREVGNDGGWYSGWGKENDHRDDKRG